MRLYKVEFFLRNNGFIWKYCFRSKGRMETFKEFWSENIEKSIAGYLEQKFSEGIFPLEGVSLGDIHWKIIFFGGERT